MITEIDKGRDADRDKDLAWLQSKDLLWIQSFVMRSLIPCPTHLIKYTFQFILPPLLPLIRNLMRGQHVNLLIIIHLVRITLYFFLSSFSPSVSFPLPSIYITIYHHLTSLRILWPSNPPYSIISYPSIHPLCFRLSLPASVPLTFLDEPTNHLDLHALVWLENWLALNFDGMAIIVSHDQYFLNSVCTDVLELRSTLAGWIFLFYIILLKIVFVLSCTVLYCTVQYHYVIFCLIWNGPPMVAPLHLL